MFIEISIDVTPARLVTGMIIEKSIFSSEKVK